MSSPTLHARHQAEMERERAILDLVLDLLVDGGFHGLSLDELARRAHVSKATLYARWPGKSALVVAALHHERAGRTDSLDHCAPASTGSLREDLRRLCADLIGGDDRMARLLLALASAVQADPAVAEAVDVELGAPFRDHCRAIVADAVERGELAASARDLPYGADLAPALVLVHLLMAPHRPLDADAVVDHVLLPVLTQGRPEPQSSRKARP